MDRNLEVHTSRLGAANDAQNVRADTAREKDNDQQNLSEMIMCYRSVGYITKLLQMPEDTLIHFINL